MDDVKGGFLLWFFCVVFDSDFGADENFSKKLFIQGKCDAVGRCGVIEKLGMKCCNFPFCDKMNSNFLAGDGFFSEDEADKFFNGGRPDRKIGLTIVNVNLQPVMTGVLGRLVTRLFSPSFHFPSSRSTSTRSNRFKTLRFFPLLLVLPKLLCRDIYLTHFWNECPFCNFCIGKGIHVGFKTFFRLGSGFRSWRSRAVRTFRSPLGLFADAYHKSFSFKSELL